MQLPLRSRNAGTNVPEHYDPSVLNDIFNFVLVPVPGGRVPREGPEAGSGRPFLGEMDGFSAGSGSDLGGDMFFLSPKCIWDEKLVDAPVSHKRQAEASCKLRV